MPMAMLLTLVGVALSGVLASVTMSHLQTSRHVQQRAAALDAAQAGLNVGLAHIRAVTTDANGYAQLNSLPCAVKGSVNGRNDPQSRSARYDVVISYFPANGAALTCPPTAVPDHAILRSTGSAQGDVRSRSLQAKYVIQTTNANIPGGVIRIGPEGTVPDLCLDAPNPAPGGQVRLAECEEDGPGFLPWKVRQHWAYLTNLTIMLVSTKGTDPLCLDTATIPHTDGAPVILRPCVAAGTTGAGLYRQQWSYNNNANFEGTSDGTTLDGFCLNAGAQNVPGTPVVLGWVSATPSTCYRHEWDSKQMFRPDPSVGAGAAPASSGAWTQLANFEQLSRCLDVPLSSNPDYVTAWPCKQAPDGISVGPNQWWSWEPGNTTSGRIRMDMPGGLSGRYPGGPEYCLQSPDSTASGKFVDVQPCVANQANQMWTMVGRVTDQNRTMLENYEASYTIKDSGGRCLSPAGNNEPYHTAGYRVSRIKVADCDGSLLQKWNAPASVLEAHGLAEYSEE